MGNEDEQPPGVVFTTIPDDKYTPIPSQEPEVDDEPDED